MQIYVATNGNHAYLMLLIENCLYQTIDNELVIIKTEHFAKAWQEGITAYVSKLSTNPFLLDMATLSSKIRNN